MLEIRKGTAVKSYENTFFREFAENLGKMFSKYSLDGLLIANSDCEAEKRLQIDALFVTKKVVCIIDFKNFGGKIHLPHKSNFDFGKWTNEEGELIKGGSSINPFIQVRNQKERFAKVFQNLINKKLHSEDKFNPYHTVTIICFQKPIDLQGSVPPEEELNFFIVDNENYLEKIRDIIDIKDNDVSISKDSYPAFKEAFKADLFDTKEIYDEPIVFKSLAKLNFEKLYPDQKAALREIEDFIKSDKDNIFLLNGSSLSGKSYLIPYIEDIAYSNEIRQVELFASSSRVANNLLAESNLEFNSMYSFIYGGGRQVDNESQEENSDETSEEIIDNISLEIVPLKKCDNDESAVFIVDESQLVADNYYQSIDLRFGSGKLLEDFLKFSDTITSKRKIIFIGDSYQIIIGNKEETALNAGYLREKYKLAIRTFHLLDKPSKSEIVKQALLTVNCINSKTFNNLAFDFSDNFVNVNKEEVQQLYKNNLESKQNSHFLCYSNAEAQEINYWIKRTIIKNGEEISNNDLVIFHNNISVKIADDPFAEPKRIFNGQFGIIQKVDGDTITEVIRPQGKQPIVLNFRNVLIHVKESGHKVKVLSFENYRLNEKAELSREEINAFKLLLKQEVDKSINIRPFDQTDYFKGISNLKEFQLEGGIDGEFIKRILKDGRTGTKNDNQIYLKKLINTGKKHYRRNVENNLQDDPSSQYYKYRNAAQLKFGWALTVHKSMSFKWDEILINTDQGENRGKANEDYFRWIYTGITRAKQKVHLINYKPLNPFSRIEIKEKSPLIEPNKGVFLQLDNIVPIDETMKSIISKYNIPDGANTNILIQVYQFIHSKLSGSNINIASISHHNNQEIYEFKAEDGNTVKISVYFKNNGQVRKPTVISQNSKLSDKVTELLLTNNFIKEFSFIKDRWRQEFYSELYDHLIKQDIQFNYIIQTSFKDTIKFSQETSELLVDMNYDGDGFFSNIIATYYNNIGLWKCYKDALNHIKNGD